MVGFSPSDVASSDSLSGPLRSTFNSTEVPVGVSPAARPAAVERSRRDSFPIAVRSRAAVSMSSAGAVGVGISGYLY
jgi:hypothetical protein